MPYSQADVEHYERLIDEARCVQPDDRVKLDRTLTSAYLDGLDDEEAV